MLEENPEGLDNPSNYGECLTMSNYFQKKSISYLDRRTETYQALRNQLNERRLRYQVRSST